MSLGLNVVVNARQRIYGAHRHNVNAATAPDDSAMQRTYCNSVFSSFHVPDYCSFDLGLLFLKIPREKYLILYVSVHCI